MAQRFVKTHNSKFTGTVILSKRRENRNAKSVHTLPADVQLPGAVWLEFTMKVTGDEAKTRKLSSRTYI